MHRTIGMGTHHEDHPWHIGPLFQSPEDTMPYLAIHGTCSAQEPIEYPQLLYLWSLFFNRSCHMLRKHGGLTFVHYDATECLLKL